MMGTFEGVIHHPARPQIGAEVRAARRLSTDPTVMAAE
jgi:hypothetical protein